MFNLVDEEKISGSISIRANQVENFTLCVEGDMDYKWSVACSEEEIAILRGSFEGGRCLFLLKNTSDTGGFICNEISFERDVLDWLPKEEIRTLVLDIIETAFGISLK